MNLPRQPTIVTTAITTTTLLIILLLHRPKITLAASTSSNNTTKLAKGFITTLNPVKQQARIALDIHEITRALNQNDVSRAIDAYTNGKHSLKIDRFTGDSYGEYRSLKELATNVGAYTRVPQFHIGVYGMGGQYNRRSDSTYMDTIVTELFDSYPASGTMAAEASLALPLWMATVQKVWEAVYDCREEQISMDVGYGGDFKSSAAYGSYAWDEAMAYWVGSDQTIDLEIEGYSLMNLAQEAEDDWGTTRSDNRLARVNEDIHDLYYEARDVMEAHDACQANSGTWETLYHVANEMVSLMTVPLVQKLVHAILEDDEGRIKLYAAAVVPQIAACRPSAHEYLKEHLYDSVNVTADNVLYVIFLLQDSYDCLGFSCSYVGAYRDTVIPACADRPKDLPLAGYQPVGKSDHFQHAKIDLDILQIKILCRMRAWPTARLIYQLGKNSAISRSKRTYRTLHSMAISNNRFNVVPFYDWFATYHDDLDYGDTAISGAFSAIGRYGRMSDAQQTEFIVKTLSYQVVYMYALEELYRSLTECQSGDDGEEVVGNKKDAISYWEKGVAYLIGSIEGHERGGSPTSDGVLFINLANERCTEFDTCKFDGTAFILDNFYKAFEDGAKFIQANDCNSLEVTIFELAHLLLFPVIQSVIRFAVINQNVTYGDDVYVKSKKVAEAEVYANAILPFLNFYDQSVAKTVKTNMVMDIKVDPVKDGPQFVVDALTRVVNNFFVRCDALGYNDNVAICHPDVHISAQNSAHSSAAMVRSASILTLCFSCLGVFGFSFVTSWF